jgi:hypothetical protein
MLHKVILSQHLPSDPQKQHISILGIYISFTGQAQLCMLIVKYAEVMAHAYFTINIHVLACLVKLIYINSKFKICVRITVF